MSSSPALVPADQKSSRIGAVLSVLVALTAGATAIAVRNSSDLSPISILEIPVATGFAVCGLLLYLGPNRSTRRVTCLALAAVLAAAVPQVWKSTEEVPRSVRPLVDLATLVLALLEYAAVADYWSRKEGGPVSQWRMRAHLLLSGLGAMLILLSTVARTDGVPGWQLYRTDAKWITSIAAGDWFARGHDIGGWMYNLAGKLFYTAGLVLALLILYIVARRLRRPSSLPAWIAALSLVVGSFATLDTFFGWHNMAFHDFIRTRWAFTVMWLVGCVVPALIATVRPLRRYFAHRDLYRIAIVGYFPLLVFDAATLPTLLEGSSLELYGFTSFMAGAQLLALAQLLPSPSSGVHGTR